MKLDSYIRVHGVTEAELARRAGCSQGTINKVRNGLGNPTFDLLRRISEATGGDFTPGEFEPRLGSEDSQDHSSSATGEGA